MSFPYVSLTLFSARLKRKNLAMDSCNVSVAKGIAGNATVTAALPAIPLATETLQESIARFFRFNRAEKSVRETYGKDIYLHTETPKITCEYYEGISPEKNREILSFLAEKLRKPSEPTHE